MVRLRTEALAVLERTHARLVELTQALPEDALDFRPSPDDWSVREVLAHLVDDELFVMRTRMARIVKEERPHLAPHDEKEWYRRRNKSRDQLEELLDDFALQRDASLRMLGMLQEENWLREAYQPEYGHFTAEGWLGIWAEHDSVHLRQISRTLSTYMNTINN